MTYKQLKSAIELEIVKVIALALDDEKKTSASVEITVAVQESAQEILNLFARKLKNLTIREFVEIAVGNGLAPMLLTEDQYKQYQEQREQYQQQMQEEP